MLTLSKRLRRTSTILFFWSDRRSGILEIPQTGEAIRLLEKGTLGDDECYVPGSWFIMGGDTKCIGSSAKEVLD